MRTLCIGDCHFGIKTNSTSWLTQQLKFFDTQIVPLLKRDDEINKIIFLGDLFDIRYAINQQIGIEVKKLIRRLSDVFNGDIYFIAGNHDYYSPLEEHSEYNAYRLVFDWEFIKCHPNVTIVDKDPLLTDDGELLLPWYWTENEDHFDDLLYNYKFGLDVKCVYCHTDLTVWPGPRTGALNGVPVYAGHIHYIVDDPIGNLHNIGATFALTFGDVNQKRYVYVLENHEIIDRIENTTTPRFTRIFNDDIFDIDSSVFENAYVQICVSTSNLNKAKYIEQLKRLKLDNDNANIRIKPIDDEETQLVDVNGEGFNTNVEKYIDDNIPDYLNAKYEIVKSKTLL